ncbi:MAG: hypothetical protein LIV24_01435 [Eubacterium sp.]|nr:hypothetical protein [Eubacterium sp.]
MNSFYLTHYFDFKNAGPFFLVSFLCLVAVMAIILAAAHAQTGYHGKKDAARMDTRTLKAVRKTHFSWIESFYEMVFSSTSVLLFLSVYYQLDAYWSPLSQYWQKYRDILLLLFILLSVLLTSWFDVALVKLTHIKSEQKACIRLLSSFYIILILLYIKFIYQDDNYDTLIQYFLLLAAGRFLYFDFTLDWFKETLAGLWRNLPMLGLMAVYSAIVCWYGFKVGFLLKSNGVIVSTLIAHLFMDLCIFVMHKTKLLRYFIPEVSEQAVTKDREPAGESMDRRNSRQRASRDYGYADNYPRNLNYAQRMRMESREYGEDTPLADLGRRAETEMRRNQSDLNRSGMERQWDPSDRDHVSATEHQWDRLNDGKAAGVSQWDLEDPDAKFSEDALSAERSRSQEADSGAGEKTRVIQNPEELYQDELQKADEIHVPEYKLDDTEIHALAHGTDRNEAGHLNYYQRKKKEEEK